MPEVQLNLFSLIPQNSDTSLIFRTSDPAKANRLRQMADKMHKAIDSKKNSAVSKQRPTARRARIAQTMYEEGLMLEQIQSWLYALADAASIGKLPDILNQITTKAQLEILQSFSKSSWTDEDIGRVFTCPNYDDWRSILAKAGINSFTQAKSAITALKQLHDETEPDEVNLQIRQLEQDLIGRKLPGYFPTPKVIVQQMLDLADIGSGQRVLEPSAGKADIAWAIRDAVDVHLDVVELQSCLRNILQLKGFNIIGCDFLNDVNGEQYDRILMNPPFERYQEIQHVQHAFSCLVPNGRLVAIISNAVTYRQDKQYSDFRDWLAKVSADDYELPNDAFLESDRPTNVKTRLLVIDK